MFYCLCPWMLLTCHWLTFADVPLIMLYLVAKFSVHKDKIPCVLYWRVLCRRGLYMLHIPLNRAVVTFGKCAHDDGGGDDPSDWNRRRCHSPFVALTDMTWPRASNSNGNTIILECEVKCVTRVCRSGEKQ